ncbi:MAG: hypothetical protein K6A44_01955 [bacterium]|nr:hypothetical protein [bacterium]
MKNFIKSTLKLAQVLCVLVMPFVIVQYYFPIDALSFFGAMNTASVIFFSNFTSMTINGIDWTLLFVIVPWILAIIALGMISNFLENLDKKVAETVTKIKLEEKVKEARLNEKKKTDSLQLKNMVYVTVSVIFSRFTISNLTDMEIEEKKEEIKKELVKNLPDYKGKVIEDEAFDDEDTFAMLFISQEDAINYMLKFSELISYFDNVTQSFGYGISFKAIMDSQSSNAIAFYVLQFEERALNTIELNEICTTNDFANRYKEFGKMKQISFASKGNYSINKSRVELNKLEY